jgi:hypothetical protein
MPQYGTPLHIQCVEKFAPANFSTKDQTDSSAISPAAVFEIGM